MAGTGWQERRGAAKSSFPAALNSWPSEANWGEKGGKKLLVLVGLPASAG